MRDLLIVLPVELNVMFDKDVDDSLMDFWKRAGQDHVQPRKVSKLGDGLICIQTNKPAEKIMCDILQTIS